MNRKILCILIFGMIGICVARYINKRDDDIITCINLRTVMKDSAKFDSLSDEISFSSDFSEEERRVLRKKPLWRCYSLKKGRHGYGAHRRQLEPMPPPPGPEQDPNQPPQHPMIPPHMQNGAILGVGRTTRRPPGYRHHHG